ncbi:PREDICTED: uncharacterized protein LOC104609193 isoform X2 [Nelumbo nucifera]|uniref:Uncharacterized protein LOC104609193 isoform X2 n=1 Tax=Nelumbo nucifera TaxID=4432 RepID=A0A1U8Q928_NELNU|nr:PREDICTED: uncharacterized protein LOC104609193 isoform X2 [Nelumbo nucifera]
MDINDPNREGNPPPASSLVHHVEDSRFHTLENESAENLGPSQIHFRMTPGNSSAGISHVPILHRNLQDNPDTVRDMTGAFLSHDQTIAVNSDSAVSGTTQFNSFESSLIDRSPLHTRGNITGELQSSSQVSPADGTQLGFCAPLFNEFHWQQIHGNFVHHGVSTSDHRDSMIGNNIMTNVVRPDIPHSSEKLDGSFLKLGLGVDTMDAFQSSSNVQGRGISNHDGVDTGTHTNIPYVPQASENLSNLSHNMGGWTWSNNDSNVINSSNSSSPFNMSQTPQGNMQYFLAMPNDSILRVGHNSDARYANIDPYSGFHGYSGIATRSCSSIQVDLPNNEQACPSRVVPRPPSVIPRPYESPVQCLHSYPNNFNKAPAESYMVSSAAIESRPASSTPAGFMDNRQGWPFRVMPRPTTSIQRPSGSYPFQLHQGYHNISFPLESSTVTPAVGTVKHKAMHDQPGQSLKFIDSGIVQYDKGLHGPADKRRRVQPPKDDQTQGRQQIVQSANNLLAPALNSVRSTSLAERRAVTQAISRNPPLPQVKPIPVPDISKLLRTTNIPRGRRGRKGNSQPTATTPPITSKRFTPQSSTAPSLSVRQTDPVHHIKWKGFVEESPQRKKEKCGLCKMNIEPVPIGSWSQTSSHQKPAVLPCRHTFHADCLELITTKEQSKDPPCISCALGDVPSPPK